MIERETTTYNQIKRKKSCYELAKYFELSDQRLTEIYDFLSENRNNRIVTTKKSIGFYAEKSCIKKKSARAKINTFDRIVISNSQFTLIPTPPPPSASGGDFSGGGLFDGGSSSNNNNNS